MQTLFAEPGIALAMKMAGKDNFLPIDWRRSNDGKQGKVNPNNFIEIAKSVERSGKTPLVAAHNPSKSGSLKRAVTAR
ncbi:MAG: hypothetical protein COY11_00700 [Candidatus Portnoybacteria bacterium CG_4_10_14_0_2_um_filter_44_20]|uniref:Uncharacterized protein n=1 Tax=Candidatus Portnoybacteria bacterium CG_4_10_14_0_2_um_filter_44_20 TaxID=1974799 RepID=A0A2M7UKU4_9BACT|nr:MAG: hypothetical protein COY11_00700 [Candidatus Portnoybacteria bacterium CG_4_10_14_0_2_um_filter_44_20]